MFVGKQQHQVVLNDGVNDVCPDPPIFELLKTDLAIVVSVHHDDRCLHLRRPQLSAQRLPKQPGTKQKPS